VLEKSVYSSISLLSLLNQANEISTSQTAVIVIGSRKAVIRIDLFHG
jgi:hypothetical protein